MESFRIGGMADSDKSDSKEDEVIVTATEFKFICNHCGKNGHKAKDCPRRDKIKCKHRGRLGYKKTTCWKLELNKSKRLEWWTDTAAASTDDSEILL